MNDKITEMQQQVIHKKTWFKTLTDGLADDNSEASAGC